MALFLSSFTQSISARVGIVTAKNAVKEFATQYAICCNFYHIQIMKQERSCLDEMMSREIMIDQR